MLEWIQERRKEKSQEEQYTWPRGHRFKLDQKDRGTKTNLYEQNVNFDKKNFKNSYKGKKIKNRLLKFQKMQEALQNRTTIMKT